MNCTTQIAFGKILLLVAFATSSTAMSSSASAQDKQQDSKNRTEATTAATDETDEGEKEKPVVEFAETYNKRFLGRSPKLGETLPDADGFLADGSPFSLQETRGKFTVFVFGCLT